MTIIDTIENEQLRKGLPEFRSGDTVRVHCKIREGEKERIQIFEGVCIRRKRGGVRATFTVLKRSFGVGVERVFPMHSPEVDRIEVVSRGKVRRSRLYYLRDLTGKAARIKGRQWKGLASKGEADGRDEAPAKKDASADVATPAE